MTTKNRRKMNESLIAFLQENGIPLVMAIHVCNLKS